MVFDECVLLLFNCLVTRLKSCNYRRWNYEVNVINNSGRSWPKVHSPGPPATTSDLSDFHTPDDKVLISGHPRSWIAAVSCLSHTVKMRAACFGTYYPHNADRQWADISFTVRNCACKRYPRR